MIELLFVCAVGTKLPSTPPPPEPVEKFVGLPGREVRLQTESEDDDFNQTGNALNLLPRLPKNGEKAEFAGG